MYMVISQRMKCRYSSPVARARIEYRVFPASCSEQEVLRSDVDVRPSGVQNEGVDDWGNRYRAIEWYDPLDSWAMSATLFVNTFRENPFDFSADLLSRPMPTDPFVYPPDVRVYLQRAYDPWDMSATVAEWARTASSGTDGAFEKIRILMNRIYQDFEFEKGITDIWTTPDDFLRLQRGVCQDFAVLLIAASRSLGLPARYVSGYVYDGPLAARSGPAPASHGWAEIYFPGIGWRGFDALNGVLACHTHVRVAQGRWYVDCAPVVGKFVSAMVHQTTETEIRVDRADAAGKSVEVAAS
jgi:transglutaminase-like putative cysteine protease